MQAFKKCFRSLALLHLIIYCSQIRAWTLVNTTEYKLNTTLIQREWLAVIASLGNSKFVICYQTSDSQTSTKALYALIYASNGTNLTSEIFISENAVAATSAPDIAHSITSINQGNNFVISWVKNGVLYMRVFDTLGLKIIDDIVVDSSASNYEQSLCSLEDKEYFVIAWLSSTYQPFAKIYNSKDFTRSSPIQVSLFASHSLHVISLERGNSFLVTWSSLGPNLVNHDIFGRKFFSNGTIMTFEILLNVGTNGGQYYPQACEIENGFVVAWLDTFGRDGDGYGVFARTFSLNMTPTQDDFQINGFFSLNQDYAKLAPIENGTKFVATWSGDAYDSSSYGIIARIFDSNGTNITQDFIVNSHVLDDQNSQFITKFPNTNSFVISWLTYDQSILNTRASFKIFSLQRCSDPNSFFFPINSSCSSTCDSGLYTPNSIAGVLSCDLNCLYYMPFNSSCVSSCSMPGYYTKFQNGDRICEPICSSLEYYYSYNDSCLSTCPVELNVYKLRIENYVKLCENACNSNEFLFTQNQTCLPLCNSLGFRIKNIQGKNKCEFNCSEDNYLMTPYLTCSPFCPNLQAFNIRNESGYLYCDFMCPDPNYFFLQTTNSCLRSCPIRYCKNFTYHICSPCPENCIDCRDSTFCLVCSALYQPKSGVCIAKNSSSLLNDTNSTFISQSSPSLGSQNIIGSITLSSIQLLALSSNEKIVYISSENGRNLLAVDVQYLESPTVINSINITNGKAIEIIDNIIYLADSTSGLRIIDANDPYFLYTLSLTPTKDAKEVAIDPTRKIAIIADLDGNLQLFNTTNLTSPVLISSLNITSKNTKVYKMTISNDGKTLFISSSTGFYIVDISNTVQPFVLKAMDNIFPSSHASNIIDSNKIYYTEASGGIKVLDVSNKSSPQILQSIATSQTQNIACYSSYCYLSSGSSIMVFDGSQEGFLVNKGAIPTFSLANAFTIKNDMKYGFLVDGTSNLRILDFKNSPAYVLYLQHKTMEIGRKYTDNLVIYSQKMDEGYEIYSQDYKFSKISFYAVNFNADSSLKRSFTNLPYWLSFDSSTNFLASNPDAASLIGEYNLYGAFSLPIPQNAFIGIGPISNINQSTYMIVVYLSRYVDENLYLTPNFDPNKELLLHNELMPYEKNIRRKLSEFYSPMLTYIQVVSSLYLNQNYSSRYYLSITTASLFSISISIIFNSTKVRFMNTVTQALAKLNEAGNFLLLTSASNDLNEALYNLRIDFPDSFLTSNGRIVINDALNPPLIVNISNMTKFFLENRSPYTNIPIQKQVNSLTIITGSQMSVFLDPKTFIDPDKDQLTFKLISASSAEDNLPSWIDFKNMVLSGIPPDQLYNELTLMIRASDGYKSVDDKFTLKIEPSWFYLFQLGASFAGPILGILGLWVYASKIYNIFCKKLYRYPREFKIEANKEMSIHQIYPIALIAGFLKEVNLIIILMKNEIKREMKLERISKKILIEYFVDKNNPSDLDEMKIMNFIENIANLSLYTTKAQNLKHYFLNLEYSRKKISSLLIMNFYLWQLELPANKQTRKVFDQMKKNWVKYIDIDHINPLGEDRLPNFFIKQRLDDIPLINPKLLEKALLSYAQFKHNLKSEMPGVSLSAKEKSSSQSLLRKINDFFNSGSFEPSNDTSGSFSNGITYKIDGDLITFGGYVSQFYKAKTMIVNVFNSSGRILRQITIKENSFFEANRQRKSRLFTPESSKLYEKKISSLARLNEPAPTENIENITLVSNTIPQHNETIQTFTLEDSDLNNGDIKDFSNLFPEEKGDVKDEFEKLGLKLEMPAQARIKEEKLDAPKSKLSSSVAMKKGKNLRESQSSKKNITNKLKKNF